MRVAEARVEDIGHAVARVAPADLVRLGAQPGDVLKITGGTSAVARAELSDDEHEGVIQIDGTTRSNCGAGLQEQVAVTIVETNQAVAVASRRSGQVLRPRSLRPNGCCRISKASP